MGQNGPLIEKFLVSSMSLFFVQSLSRFSFTTAHLNGSPEFRDPPAPFRVFRQFRGSNSLPKIQPARTTKATTDH
jgi:hypothetical protein